MMALYKPLSLQIWSPDTFESTLTLFPNSNPCLKQTGHLETLRYNQAFATRGNLRSTT